MKKILSIIMVVAMLIPNYTAVSAAEAKPEILLNVDYDDMSTNSMPSTVKTTGEGSVTYVAEIDGGKSLLVKNRWSDTYIEITQSIGSGVVWVDTRIKAADYNTDRQMLSISDGVSMKPFGLINVSRTGVVSDYQGIKYRNIDLTKWHRYTVAINAATLRYDIYIDGTMIAERAVLPSGMRGIKNVGFSAMSNATSESTMYNDYVRAYYSDTIPDENVFPKPKYDYSTRRLKNTQVKQVEEGQKLLYDEDYSSYTLGAIPSGVVVQGGLCRVAEEEDGNKYFSLEWTKGGGAVMSFALSSMGVNENLPLQTVLQCDVKVPKNKDSFYLYCLRDDDDPYNFSRPVLIGADGEMKMYNGASLGANCYSEWVTVAIVCDFETKMHKVYINNEPVVDRVAFQTTKTINRMKHLRFQTNSVLADGQVMIDNIKIYSGTEPYDENNAINGGSAPEEMPEKAEIWDYEISEQPLSVDMKAFTAAEEYASLNPSAYLTNYSIAKETFKDAIVLVENNSNIWMKGKKYTSPYKVLWEDLHFIAPAELLASLAGEKAEISGDSVTIGSFKANVGSNIVTVDGTEYSANVAVKQIDGKVYIPVREFVVHKLKKYYSESQRGMAIIADKQMDINASNYQTAVTEMLAYMILDRPNAEAIRSAFESTTGKGVHPRLYGPEDRVKELFKVAQTDELLNWRIENLIAYADKSLNNNFTTGGHTVMTNSFEVVEALYVAYLMTGDEKYPKKAAELALLLSNMSTWNHDTYFLDVGFWMLVCAEVYDLFYDALPVETRNEIAWGIIEKGLIPAKDHYYGSSSDWPKRTTNWNSVCNGGAMVAAAALLGEGYNDELCLDVVEKSFISAGYQLCEYAPYGALFESSSYFGYGTQYLVRAVEAYKNTLGDDFGIMDYPGFADLGEFLFHIESSSGGWSFHDDPQNVTVSNMYASWSAYYTGNIELQKARQIQIERRNYTVDFLDVLFYLPQEMPAEIGLPLDKSFKGDAEITTSRSDWGENQFFMGIHAGPNNLAHGQWDMGNFVYEAFGIRFATDIGRDDYNLGNDYFAEGGAKRKFYVHRTEGQNLYVINPDETAGQLWKAKTQIEEIESKAKGSAYKVDLTPAYYNQADEAVRGYMLTNDRSVFVVQDEIKTKDFDDEIKWFWHTQADITINDDKTVTLTRKGKSVTLYFDSNVDFDIEAGLGEPLPSSPTVDGQLKIGNLVNKLTVTFYSDEEKIYFRCMAVPYGHEMEIGEIVPISEWTIPDGENNNKNLFADMIYVNGQPLDGFDPKITDYSITGKYKDGLPTVTADSNHKVVIRQAESKYNTAVITIEGADGASKIYSVSFVDASAVGIPYGTQYVPVSVKASDSDSNAPEGAIDNNLDTRWSGMTTKYGWLELDLGEQKDVNAVAIGVFNGKTRSNKFDILVSVDGENYISCIKDGATSGKTEQMEVFEFEPVKARYVKLIGYGADTSDYNSYTEFHAYKLDD